MKYLCDPEIIPGVIPKSAGELNERTEMISQFAQWLHLDVCDGVFTPDKNWPISDLNGVPSALKVEAHLMVAEPRAIGEVLIHAGVQRVIAHREAFQDIDAIKQTFAAWKEAGAHEVGLALLLHTPITEIDAVAGDCDVIQLMSIGKVGHQGEPFDDLALSRVEELHATYPDMMVSVDGGISEGTVEQLVRAGANRIIVGHTILESNAPAELYASIHARAMRGCAPVTIEMNV